MGRRKKYATLAALKNGVNAYFASISYQRPVVVCEPTGLVLDGGKIEYKTVLLRDGTDGTGKPKTTLEYTEPPSVAALCLYLGISRETWSNYAADDTLKPVVEEVKLRMEAYWTGLLTDKSTAFGAKFVLASKYHYNERVEVTHREGSVEDYLRDLEEREADGN